MRIQYASGHVEVIRNRGWRTTVHMMADEGVEVDFIPRSAFANWFALLRRIRGFRPDVLYVSDLFGVPLGIMNRLGLLPCPALYYWCEYHEDLYRPYFPMRWRWVRALTQWFMIACFDHVWSNCLYNANRARARGKRVRYIFNAYHEFDEPSHVALPAEGFKVVYVGDLVGSRKNLDALFDAVRGENCTLYLAGQKYPQSERGAPPNAVFVGPVPQEQLTSFLRQADVLVNASDEDGNLKTSEYIHAARPILAYRGARGCLENVFTHRYNAYVTSDLKKGLRELMADAPLRERLARNLANYPILNWRENTRLRMEYFQELIDESRSRRGGRPGTR